MGYDELKDYAGHVAYMCLHATSGTYTDKAFHGYDKAVREKAKAKGLQAFKLGDQELSLPYFTLVNTMPRTGVVLGGVSMYINA